MNIQVNVNSAAARVSSHRVQAGAGSKNQGLRLKAQKFVKYELVDDATGFAPENIATKRVGEDLHIAFEKSDIAAPDLVIEGYYDEPGTAAIIGKAESGVYYNYVPESGLRSEAVSMLGDGTFAGQALGGEQFSMPLWLASSAVSPAAVLLGGLLLSGIAAAGGSGSTGGIPAPSPGPQNNAPIAPDQRTSTLVETPLSGRVLGSDVDGDTLTYDKGRDPAHGTLVVNPDGSFTYTPNENYRGPDSFTVIVRDGKGGVTTSTINVEVTPVNKPPIATDDSTATPFETPLNGINVLGNDRDPDGDPLTVSGASVDAGKGTVTINPDGTLNFIPGPGVSGHVTITYTITDGNGGTDTAILTVTVGAENVPAVLEVTPGMQSEGYSLVHTVTLSGTSSKPQTYEFSISDVTTDPSDWGAPIFSNGVIDNGDGTITVPAGVGSFDVSVPALRDTISEPSESYTINVGGQSSIGTIFDLAPPLSVAVSDAAPVSEGSNLVYTVTLTGGTASTDITIPVTYTGTAADGNDYTSVASVTILAGQTTGTLTVPTNTDTVAEGDETVVVTLGTPSLSGVTVVDGEASGTITDVAPTLTVSIADAPSVNEGGDLVYTVTLTGGTSATDITIPVTYTGTAADGSDYTSVASVTIPAGETTGTLTVPTNTDTIAEGDETVIVTLGTPSLAGVTVVDGEASGTITDVAPTLTVSIADAPSVNEGGDLVYTVTLTGGTSATDITIPVTYTGTAADGSDYTSVASVTIPAGETTGTLTVPTNTDTIAEGDETVVVTLGTPSLAGVTVVDGEASGTITDVAPALTVSIADAPSVNEGGDLVYTVTLTGGTSATDITIPVTYTGTAADGSDYTSVANVTIPAGETTGTLTVPTNTDTVAEGDETVIVNLGTPSLAGVTVTEGSATGTIKDVAPSLSVSISDAPSVNEGGDLVYTVTLTGGTSATDITIPVTYTGTAADGSDYTSVASVTIPAGETTGTLTVPTLTDSVAEGDETVIVTLGTPSLAGVTVVDGEASGTITDVAPTLTVSIADAPSVNEGGDLVYTVTLTGGTSATDITIPVTYTGTAADGSDYTSVANVTIPAGETTGTLTVPTNTDTIAEGDETVVVTLGTPSLAGVTVVDGEASGTITDVAPTLTVSIADAPSVNEGGDLVYTVTLTGGTSATDITIPVTYTGTAADGSDYTSVANVTIPAGETTGTLTVPTNTDTVAEGDETVVVTLGTPSLSGVTVVDGEASGTITDVAPALTVSIADAPSVNEGGDLVYTVTLTGGTSATDITIPVTYTGTAADGSDYTSVASVTILAGQTTGTLTVPTNTDTIAEGDETVVVTLGTPSLAGVTVVDGEASGTITDVAPTLTVSIADAPSVNEGGDLVYTVTLTGGTSATDITIPVTYTGTAADGSDYTSVANVTIPAGETTGTLTVPTNTDTIAEGDETVIVTLGTPSLAGVTVVDGEASGTITDVAPTLTVSIADAPSVNEGGDLVYTVTLTGGTSATDITIPVTYTGTAADGSDYTSVASVTILAGQTTGTLTVPTNTDTVAEGDETVIVNLGTPSLAGVTVTEGSATGTIKDVAPSLSVSISDAPSVNEGGDLVYTVTLTGGTSATDITIPLVYGGTASSGTDYTAGPTSVTIPAGSTSATVTVVTIPDSIAEGNETVTVGLGSPPAGVTVTGGAATGTIIDDDTAPVFEDPNAGSTPPGVNDPGTIFTPSVGEQPSSYTISYNENSLSGSQLGRVKATDLDGGTVTYAFAGTVPGGATPWYAINATTGVITLTAAGQASLANDYEDAGGLNSRQVVVRASDGTNTTDIVVTLQELDVPENSPPTISSVTSATVSEEGLTGGIADSTGTPTDTTNSVSATGTISITDASSSAEQLTVALSGPASGAIKSGGVNVVWTWDAATMTLTGKAGATSVMTIAVGSVTGSGGSYSAGYTATLLKPIDHATGGTPGIEDVLNLGFSATVTDNTSLSHSSSFTVSVEDDMPVAQPSSQSYVLPSQNSNILLVLDVSWSMREVDAGATKSRLEIMKDAVKLMLDAYDALGDVSVRIVTFGVGANAYGSTWVSVSDAKTYVGTLTADSYGTHYSTALTTAQTAYASEGKIAGANNVAYFLTDGAPTANYEITSALETTWTSFLNTNDINAFAYGMGPAAPQSPIDPAAYDGRSSGTNTNAIVVADTTQLPPILRDSVGANASGSVITGSGGFTGDSELGADGGSLNSVTVNGRTYGADGAVTGGTSRGSWNSTTFTWTISTESSTGNVSEGGKLVIRMDDGTYTYTPPIVLSSGTHVENFGFSLIDRDGDTAASTLTLTVYPAGTVLPKSQVSESLLLDSDGNVDSFGAYSIGYEELMLGADDHAMRSIPSTADTSEFSGFAYLPDADPAWNTQSGGQLVDNPSTLHLNGVLI